MTVTKLKFKLTPENNSKLRNLCGEHNSNLKQIQEHFSVEINNRGHEFCLTGKKSQVELVKHTLETIFNRNNQNYISNKEINAIMQTIDNSDSDTAVSMETIIKTPKLTIKPRGTNQTNYIKNILKHDINFGIGPAGTGKTYLAVAYAVWALLKDEVSRIIITRPAVEAGERLGYLPGDIAQKVDPYLRPIYDALYEMVGFEKTFRLIEQNIIEIAPLAFMRGRTLNDAIIILDEAQNTTVEQMKMFLTRIGFNSKAIITGDITQIDLPKSTMPGLKDAIDILQRIKNIGFTFFQAKDVVRHPLVQKIIKAYEQQLRKL